MADIKLDLSGTDPDLDVSGADLAIVSGDDAIVQHLTIRFGLFKGEWFLNRRVGVPYFTDIFVKNPSLSDIRTIVSRIITGTPGIASLDSLALEVDAAARELSVEFTAAKDDGGVLDFSQVFILPGGVQPSDFDTETPS